MTSPRVVMACCVVMGIPLVSILGFAKAPQTGWREQSTLAAHLDAHNHLAFDDKPEIIVNTGVVCRPQDAGTGFFEVGGLIYVVHPSGEQAVRTDAFCLLAGHAAPQFMAEARPVPDTSGNVASLGWRNHWTVSIPSDDEIEAIAPDHLLQVIDRVHAALDQQKVCDPEQEDALWAARPGKVRHREFVSCDARAELIR